MLNVMILSVVLVSQFNYFYADGNDYECFNGECRILFILIFNFIILSIVLPCTVMLNIIILSVIMLSVIMLSVIILNALMLSVMRPRFLKG